MTVDMSQYLDIFLEESREHLANLNQCLLDLEHNPGNMQALDEIFRAAHTLKGMSSTMGFEDMADLTHHMEDILSDLKEGILLVNNHVIDVIFKCLDRLQLMVERIAAGHSGEVDNIDLIEVLQNIRTGSPEFTAEEELPQDGVESGERFDGFSAINSSIIDFNEYDQAVLKEAFACDYKVYYINIAVEKGCLMKAVRSFMVFKALEEDGEVIKSLPPAQELEEGRFEGGFETVFICKSSREDIVKRLNRISEVKVKCIDEITAEVLAGNDGMIAGHNEQEAVMSQIGEETQRGYKLKQKVRVDIDKLDDMMNLVGELVMHKGRLEQIGLVNKLAELNETIEQFDRATTELQSVVMKVRMIPIEQVFNRFPRMVRDLAKELNKDIDFIMEGKETELDRTIIDEIGDPLVHLLRNAIDHGMELPEERSKKGKAQRGKVRLRAKHEGNSVYIEVEDDGKGIDVKGVIQKGLDKGIITEKEAEQMNNEEAYRLLFSPGFSTASTITDISGRGVGLDVVKAKMEGIGGEISVDSKPGQGSKFTIKLPLTLAIIQALMVSVADEIYAIPLSSVDETTMVNKKEIKMVQNQEVIMLRGNVLPLIRLKDLLLIPGEVKNQEEMYVVIVRKGDRQVGLVVDTLIGQQEIVIKSMGKLLNGIPGLAGAIVAGDGNVRLILDIATLY